MWLLGWSLLSCGNVYACAQGNILLLDFMLSRVEVFTSFSFHPGRVLSATSGAHGGVGCSVVSFLGPPPSGTLSTPQGNYNSVYLVLSRCVDCYVTVSLVPRLRGSRETAWYLLFAHVRLFPENQVIPHGQHLNLVIFMFPYCPFTTLYSRKHQ